MKCVDSQRVRGERFVFSSRMKLVLDVSATFVPVGRRGVSDLQFLPTWFANTWAASAIMDLPEPVGVAAMTWRSERI